MNDVEARKWALLGWELHKLKLNHGLGAASVWGLVNSGDYDGANQKLDEIYETLELKRPPALLP